MKSEDTDDTAESGSLTGEMTVETTGQANQRMVNATYKLTAFCPAMPEAWFAIAEADMSQRSITDDFEKFNKLLSALGVENASRLKNDLGSVPATEKYEYLKEKVLAEFTDTEETKFDRVFANWSCTTLSDGETPSKLMQRMLDNATSAFQKTSEFKMMFLRQLPPDIRPLLAASAETDLKRFAVAADKAVANYRAETRAGGIFNINSTGQEMSMAELAEELAELRLEINHVRRGASSKAGGNSKPAKGSKNKGPKPADVCFFHWRFGDAAMNCQSPCKFSGATGNGQGRRGQ